MCFQILNGLTFVFELTNEPLLLQLKLSQRLLLRELCRIQALIRQPQLRNFIPNQLNLMLLLFNLIIFISNIRLEVPFLILHLASQIKNLRPKRTYELSLRQYLFLHFLAGLVRPQRIVLNFCFISGLHLRLLHKHLFLNFIDLFLFLNLHLVDNSPILFPQLLNVVHQLFISLLGFYVGLLKINGLFC